MIVALRVAAILAFILSATGALAETSPSRMIALYPQGAIEPLKVPEIREDPGNNGQINIRNVSGPTLEMFSPAVGRANGTAVIVIPGGGFMNLVYDNEGTTVARQLAQQGVTAFVLKYRLVQTPTGYADMQAKMMNDMDGVLAHAKSGSVVELPRFNGENIAVADAGVALELVRTRAAEWGLNDKRIGVLGFSAGAFVAADLAIGDPVTRPDFVGLIYGGLRTPVPANAPPAFIAAAADDLLLPKDAVPLYSAWKAAGVAAELHVYEHGGHGFGMNLQGTTSDHWFKEFTWWMQARGLIAPGGS